MAKWQIYNGESLLLNEDVIHVWRMLLPDFSSQIAQLSAVISNQERHNAARFVRSEDGIKYTLTKALQRMILSRYLGGEPGDLVFDVYEHGKPFVQNDQDIQFNLSHSGDGVLLGVAKSVAIGVDLEKKRNVIDFKGLVDRFFSPIEKKQFHALDSASEKQAFYNTWVKKEAFIKATGYGLSFPLSGFSVRVCDKESGNPNALLGVHNEKREFSDWLIQELVLPSGQSNYCAAVATEPGVNRLVCWHLSPEFKW